MLVSSVISFVIVIVTPRAPSELRDVLLELTMTSQSGCVLVPRISFQVAFLSAKEEVPVSLCPPLSRHLFLDSMVGVADKTVPVSRPPSPSRRRLRAGQGKFLFHLMHGKVLASHYQTGRGGRGRVLRGSAPPSCPSSP